MKITITEQIKDVKMVYEIEGSKEEVISAVFDLGINLLVAHRWEAGDYGKVVEYGAIAKATENSMNSNEQNEFLQLLRDAANAAKQLRTVMDAISFKLQKEHPAPEEVCRGVLDTFKPDEIPEYLEDVDLSVIPDDWEEVWITQDSNDDIIAYNNVPVISTEGTWWMAGDSADLWTRVKVSGNSYSAVVNTTWKDSLYRYR